MLPESPTPLPPPSAKPIPDYPDYSVTDTGEVWSCLARGARNAFTRRGGGALAWCRLRLTPDRDGYLQVNLRRRTHKVHRLVLLTFVGPCPPGRECCHKDGNRNNNLLDNLAWGTKEENQADCVRHGTQNRGERNGSAKLTAGAVRAAREDRRAGDSFGVLARRYGVSKSTIHLVVTGRLWAHVV